MIIFAHMRTKILEASVTINNKLHSLINTNMDIEVIWDAKLNKMDNQLDLEIDITSVQGFFQWITNADTYSIDKRYRFCTDNTWNYKIIKENMTMPIFPTYANIDFDKKEIIINL